MRRTAQKRGAAGHAALFVPQLFPIIRLGVAVKHVAGMHRALNERHAQPRRAFAQCAAQRLGGIGHVLVIAVLRFGIAFVWLAVPAGWLANFLISYAALRRSWPEDKAAVSQ